jgi:hypothetical protein
MPQIPEVQSSSSVQVPVRMGARQAPALQVKPCAQSAAERQDVLQPLSEPTSLQEKWPRQDSALTGAQAPAPLQPFWVIAAPTQVMGQAVSAPGKEQAPVWSQPLASQIGLPASQAWMQQLPLPLVPQTPEAQALSEVHGCPAPSSAIPPVVPLVVDFTPELMQAVMRKTRPATMTATARIEGDNSSPAKRGREAWGVHTTAGCSPGWRAGCRWW